MRGSVVGGGVVVKLVSPDHALAVQLSDTSQEKYGYAPGPEDYEASGVHVFHPQVAFAWKQFPRDETRWKIPAGG
jgi:hypothetical protein